MQHPPTPMGPPPDAYPHEAPRTSPSAVTSIVAGLLLCFGPLSALLAIGAGIAALRDVRRSGGRLGGGGYASTGIALGGFNLFCSSLLLLAFVRSAGSPTAPPPPFAPIVGPMAPPTATAPPLHPKEEEGGQMTPLAAVTETHAGKITIVDLPPSVEPLVNQLDAERKKAAAAKEKLVVLTVREGCRPCMSVAAVALDPKMQAALDHVRIVRIDVLADRDQLEDLGIPTEKIPGFYLLGPTLHAVDGITGEEWDDDTAENAAPVLGAFVRGTYAKRRARFEPPSPASPHAPRPPPTML